MTITCIKVRSWENFDLSHESETSLPTGCEPNDSGGGLCLHLGVFRAAIWRIALRIMLIFRWLGLAPFNMNHTLMARIRKWANIKYEASDHLCMYVHSWVQNFPFFSSPFRGESLAESRLQLFSQWPHGSLLNAEWLCRIGFVLHTRRVLWNSRLIRWIRVKYIRWWLSGDCLYNALTDQLDIAEPLCN